MINNEISAHTPIQTLINSFPELIQVFLQHRMACVGCDLAAFDTLADAAHNHHVDLDQFMNEIRAAVKHINAVAQNSEKTGGIMGFSHTYIPNLADLVEAIPEGSIVSRTIVRENGLKAILFAFDQGQELSQHTASVPAIIQILEGECELILGEERYAAVAGSWAFMPANLPHSLMAHTPVRMLLLMLQKTD